MTIRLHTPAPPFNRWGTRLGNSTGGAPPGRTAWAVPAGVESTDARMPQDLNDGAISRERMPWSHQGYYLTPGGGWFDWTNNAPQRAALHMRDVTLVRQQGTSNTRNQDPVPAILGVNDGTGSLPAGIRQLNQSGLSVDQNFTPHGMHTMQARKPRTTTQRYLQTPQQRPPRQNRLSNSRNTGQSYSQTTIHQGG